MNKLKGTKCNPCLYGWPCRHYLHCFESMQPLSGNMALS